MDGHNGWKNWGWCQDLVLVPYALKGMGTSLTDKKGGALGFQNPGIKEVVE